MSEYDQTFYPNIPVLIGHCDLFSRFSDFALYLGTQLVYEQTSFFHCLIEQTMKVLERVVEGLIRQIDEMQCGFMSGCGITDAIFIICQLQEKHLAANKLLYMAFVDLEIQRVK